jgi:hypothetical protein
MNIICHVKYPLFLSNFNLTWISSIHFENAAIIKFRKNSSSGNRVVLWGDTDRQTKLIIAFWNCANGLKIEYFDRHTTVLDLNYLPTALHQAAKSMNCMHMSTGIQSGFAFGSANTVRTIPLPLPTMRLTVQLNLSIHPGTGSVQLWITARNR